MAPERVLILGATGTVGRAATASIQADPRLTAIQASRRGRAAQGETRVVDATDTRALIAALQGCSLAVNAVGGAPALLCETTRALCLAAREIGLRRLVHVSSMAVYGGSASGMVTENAPFAAAPTPYEAAKIACEAQLEAHAAAGQDAVILRPGLVFGPDSAQWALRIARLLRARRLGDLGAGGDGFCNLTYAPDLGAGIVRALLSPAAAGLAFNLATPAPPTWNAFFEAFARALGATPVRRISHRRLTAETRLLAPGLQAAKIAAGRAGLTFAWLPDPIPASLLRLFAQRMRLDPALTDRVLDVPRTPDAEAIEATAAKLRLP